MAKECVLCKKIDNIKFIRCESCNEMICNDCYRNIHLYATYYIYVCETCIKRYYHF